VVCLSQTTGSGGEEVGRLVAERLGYLYVDEDIVAKAAARGGVEPRDVADEERRKSFARRMLETLGEGSEAWQLAGGVPVAVEGLDSGDIRALIRETVVQTAARGKVVIVSHAASYAVEPSAEKLRVLVTASPASRSQRVAASEQVDQKRADGVIKESDAARRDYLKRFYDVDRESPTDYDLVLNTDVISSERAADLIARAAS
jgi:cytidylate kinase